MNASEFVWTFPVYILATNYTMSPATEKVIFDDKIRFITPEAWPGGPCAIALFTDAHLAEQFRDESSPGLDVLPLRTPSALKEFLERAKGDYLAVVVDLNRKTRRATPFFVQEAIAEMDRLTSYENDLND